MTGNLSASIDSAFSEGRNKFTELKRDVIMGNLYELMMAGSGGVDDGDGDSWFAQNLNEKYSRDWLELLHNC